MLFRSPSAPQAEKILNTSGALVPEGPKIAILYRRRGRILLTTIGALGPEGPTVPSFSAAGGENFGHHRRFGAGRPQSALLQRRRRLWTPPSLWEVPPSAPQAEKILNTIQTQKGKGGGDELHQFQVSGSVVTHFLNGVPLDWDEGLH